MRRGFLTLLGLVGLMLALGAACLRVPAVQDRLMRGVIEDRVGSRSDGLFAADALRVLLCGSGSPLPDENRARACVAVFAAGRFWVVDTGNGSWNRLALLGVDGARIGGVLLSHFHSDHIGDLGEFQLNTWVMGRARPLPVFGPPGVERVTAGFQEAYALDTRYRILHHGAALLPESAAGLEARPIPGPASGAGPERILDEDGLRVTAFAVDHDPIRPAYGYRFDYGGRSAVVSGDTARSEALIQVARGADLLLHDALADHMVSQIGEATARAGLPRMAKVMADIPDYHATPRQAAEVANAAGVELLVLYHLVPPPPGGVAERVFSRGVSELRPDGWMLGGDGLLVELPLDSDAVRTRQLR